MMEIIISVSGVFEGRVLYIITVKVQRVYMPFLGFSVPGVLYKFSSVLCKLTPNVCILSLPGLGHAGESGVLSLTRPLPL